MEAVKYAVCETWRTTLCAAMSSHTSTGTIQEIGWSTTYRTAARMKGPSASWATTGCRKGHKRGIRSSVQWGQARAELACRRNEGRSSDAEQRQPLYVEVNNSSPGGADLSEQQRPGCLTGTAGWLATAGLRFSLACPCMHGVRRSRGMLQAMWTMKELYHTARANTTAPTEKHAAAPWFCLARRHRQTLCCTTALSQTRDSESQDPACARRGPAALSGPSRRWFACLAKTLEFLCGRAPSLPLHLSNKTSPWPLLLLPGFFNILRPVPPGTEQLPPHHAVTTTSPHLHLPSTPLPLRTPSPLLGFFSPP